MMQMDSAATVEQQRFDILVETLQQEHGIEPEVIVCDGLNDAIRARSELSQQGFSWPFRYNAQELNNGRSTVGEQPKTFDEEVLSHAPRAGRIALLAHFENGELHARDYWAKTRLDSN